MCRRVGGKRKKTDRPGLAPSAGSVGARERGRRREGGAREEEHRRGWVGAWGPPIRGSDHYLGYEIRKAVSAKDLDHSS